MGLEILNLTFLMENNVRFKIIERFDSYFSGINNKSAFLLAFNSFLIGALMIGYKDLIGIIDCAEKVLFDIFIGAVALLSITSMVFTILAIIPYSCSKNFGDRKSVWFFGDIAGGNKKLFFDNVNTISEDQQKQDLNNQIFELSKGLRIKHRYIKAALIFNLIEVFLLIPIFYLILN